MGATELLDVGTSNDVPLVGLEVDVVYYTVCVLRQALYTNGICFAWFVDAELGETLVSTEILIVATAISIVECNIMAPAL